MPNEKKRMLSHLPLVFCNLYFSFLDKRPILIPCRAKKNMNQLCESNLFVVIIIVITFHAHAHRQTFAEATRLAVFPILDSDLTCVIRRACVVDFAQYAPLVKALFYFT